MKQAAESARSLWGKFEFSYDTDAADEAIRAVAEAALAAGRAERRRCYCLDPKCPDFARTFEWTAAEPKGEVTP